MARLSGQQAVTTTTTPAPIPTEIISKLAKGQKPQSNSLYVSLETTTATTPRNSSTNIHSEEYEQIKTVCW